MTFDNIDKLLDYIQDNVNDVLQDEVSEAVKETHTEVVDDLVYDSYSPKIYLRRGDHGGLSDDSNMHCDMVADGEMEFTNQTPFNEEYGSENRGYLIDLIEHGDGYGGYQYNYAFGRNASRFTQPRPVMQETEQRLFEQDILYKQLKQGLKKRGINAE